MGDQGFGGSGDDDDDDEDDDNLWRFLKISGLL